MTVRFDDYARSAETSLSLFQRLHLGLLMLLVTACGALSAAAWQAIERSSGREAAHERELQHFHASLIGEMRSLAENSGMLTSADLCLVRFRLRHKDKWNRPIQTVEAVLTRPDQTSQTIRVEMGPDGVVNFGLVVPGRYLLELTNASGYRLRHEFDVVPGVPVDRLVLCPFSTDVAHLETRIDPVLAPALHGRGLVPMYYIERDDISVGEWTWQPTERGGIWVAPALAEAGKVDPGFEFPADLSEPADVLATVPYLVARCAAIAVYQSGTEAGGVPALLGMFRFQEPDDSPPEVHWPEPVLVVEGPFARHHASIYDRTPIWRIELPPEVSDRIEGLLNGGRSNPAGSWSQLPPPPPRLHDPDIVPRT